MKKLSLLSIFMLLNACGGGGGGGALVNNTPTVATPTYTEYVNFINNGGTVPNVQGQIFRQETNTVRCDWGWCVGRDSLLNFQSFSSITLQYSTPDASGNQSISMSGTVDWDGDPFSGSDTYTGTLNFNEDYHLFMDDHLASVYTTQDDIDVFTIGFVDFGGSRTLEKTQYVTQLLQFRRGYSQHEELAFVMGDQTWNSDMPSSGSATYNGFTQMFLSENPHTDPNAEITTFYYNGNAVFNVDFATRNFTGELSYYYLAYPWAAHQTLWPGGGYSIGPIILDGTISGNSFSGEVDMSNIFDQSRRIYTSSFEGNFYGPNATELAGIFQSSIIDYEYNGHEMSFYTLGTFTGCQGC